MIRIVMIIYMNIIFVGLMGQNFTFQPSYSRCIGQSGYNNSKHPIQPISLLHYSFSKYLLSFSSFLLNYLLQDNNHNNNIDPLLHMKDNNSFSIYLPLSSSVKRTHAKNDRKNAQKSLSLVIAETQIREKNFQYQQLLINHKQLEIQLNEQKNQFNELVKKRKKVQKFYEDAQNKVNLAKLQYKQKRHFLDKYYEALDKKFKGGKQQLFRSLSTLEQNLLHAYLKDEKRLRDSLKIQEQEFNKVDEFINIQRIKRDNLKMQFLKMQVQMNNHSFGVTKNTQNQLQQLKNENKFYQQQIQRLNKQKKKAQVQQKILKKIQNIEQQHRKHTAIILFGIKKIFTIKLKEQNYKEAVLPEYIKNINGIKQILMKRKNNKESLLRQIAQKRQKLQKIMKDVNDKNRVYGELQDQYLKQLK